MWLLGLMVCLALAAAAPYASPRDPAAASEVVAPAGAGQAAALAPAAPAATAAPSTPTEIASTIPTAPAPTVTPAPTATPPFYRGPSEIGRSFNGHPVHSYELGYGPTKLALVGGMHGGYEWNTILLAYELLDYFQSHPAQIPDAVTLLIVPNANPDGLSAVSGRTGRFSPDDLLADTSQGRFNGRGVDLNRNWDCNWSSTAVWRDEVVSGGDEPFSEPESVALRDFFLDLQPSLVIFYHSAAGGVYAAGCGVTGPRSFELSGIYGLYSGYPRFATFDAYPITGDAGNWLTLQDIASFTVELTTHEAVEFGPNLAGVLALLEHYAAASTPAPAPWEPLPPE
jgi:hypothetical protein